MERMVWSCEAKALEVARASRSRRHEPEERASLMGERLSRYICLLYTADAADGLLGVHYAGCRILIIQKRVTHTIQYSSNSILSITDTLWALPTPN